MPYVDLGHLNESALQKLHALEQRAVERTNCSVTIEKAGLLSVENGIVTCLNLPSAANFFEAATVFKHDFSAQSYGSQYEALLRHSFGLAKVNPRDKLGDARHPLLGEIEIKVSISTEEEFRVRQVRIARPIDYYLLGFINTRISAPYVYVGFVPSDVIKSLARSQTHGCMGGIEGDDPMRSFDVSLGSPELARLERYNLF